MNCKKVILFILILSPILAFGIEKDFKPSVNAGNSLYEKGHYKDALTEYQNILNQDYQSAELFFNIGNAFYKTGDIPSALLYYEKARKLSPGDEDINFNIQLLNSKITDKIEPVPEFFLNKWWLGMLFALSAKTFSVICILLVLAGSGLFVLYLFTNSVRVKKGSFYLSFTLFSLGLMFLLLANSQNDYLKNHREAIVFASSVTVKSEPSERGKLLFMIHEGLKVEILKTSAEWIQVRISNGNEGWILARYVMEI